MMLEVIWRDASVSKRPFPTSQSDEILWQWIGNECIKEAVPDQPELRAACSSNSIGVYQRGRSRPARAGVENLVQPAGVYQRGRSRPARAQVQYVKGEPESVSKRPFPTSQSRRMVRMHRDQSVSKRPFPTSQSAPARRWRALQSVSKRPFPTSQSARIKTSGCCSECIKEAVPDQPERYYRFPYARSGVYQRGRSRPARAKYFRAESGGESVSKRPFPTSQSLQRY